MAKGFLSKLEKGLIWFFDIGQVIILIGMALVVFYYTLGQVFAVQGVSMEPNFSTGQWLLVSKINYYFHTPNRGEVVVFHFPGTQKDKYIKRVIGLPGEKIVIEKGKVKINGEVLYEGYLPKSEKTEGQVNVKLNKGEYFVLGDNRNKSNDSRVWGPLPKNRIIGRAVSIFYPFDQEKTITVPKYHLTRE